MLFYTVSQKEQESLSYMVSLLKSDFGVTVNKQSMNERFNENCETYVKAVLKEVWSEKLANIYDTSFLSGFSRILIKDSTKFMVPPSLEHRFRNSGGNCGGDRHSRSNAGVSIQYEYDLKSGKINDLNVTTAVRTDQKDAGETASNVEKGDLIIRDLGYFSTPVLKSFTESGAFFLSKLNSGTNVYDAENDLVSFKNIYATFKKKGFGTKEMSVFIGRKTKVPVRMILQLVPDEVYDKRIREKTRTNRDNGLSGNLAEETKIRCRFNLFITNAEKAQLAAEQAFPLYKLRWQIELQFKIWKSVFKINDYRKIKEHRYTTFLYVKLILIIVNLQISYGVQLSVALSQKDRFKVISLNKSMKTLKNLFREVFVMLRGNHRKAKDATLYIRSRLAENHWLECKNKKLCFPEILHLFICYSDK